MNAKRTLFKKEGTKLYVYLKKKIKQIKRKQIRGICLIYNGE